LPFFRETFRGKNTLLLEIKAYSHAKREFTQSANDALNQVRRECYPESHRFRFSAVLLCVAAEWFVEGFLFCREVKAWRGFDICFLEQQSETQFVCLPRNLARRAFF